MPLSTRLLTSGLALVQPQRADGIFFLANRGAHDLAVGDVVVKPGGFQELPAGPAELELEAAHGCVEHAGRLAEGTAGRHSGLVVDSEGCRAFDTNDLQAELARSAYGCPRMDWGCVAQAFLGGIAPTKFTERVFLDSWVDWDFWDLCTLREPTPALRSVRTRTGHDLEILRESPMVASVRGFASEAECQELAGAAQTRGLAMDPVVSGCAASRERLRADREMFSTSLRVNWRVEDTLSSLAARSFDLASDMLDVDVPMNEGQEKIKLYHYIKGFEHRPHHDGARTQRGSDSNEWRRVATTLIYCEAAEEGGATVFTGGPSTYLPKSMKFRPRRGDILFFAYDPDPEFEATYAECPVLEGNKTTLAQWYRPGVPGAPSWSGSRFSVHDRGRRRRGGVPPPDRGGAGRRRKAEL